MADLAVATIEGCTWAGVTLNRTGRLVTGAASASIVEQADELQ